MRRGSGTIIDDDGPSPEALEQMRDAPYNFWAAYQNEDLGHHGLGDLTFLACGPGSTLGDPPVRMPDFHDRINWRYQFAGYVNLETGSIVKDPPQIVEYCFYDGHAPRACTVKEALDFILMDIGLAQARDRAHARTFQSRHGLPVDYSQKEEA